MIEKPLAADQAEQPLDSQVDEAFLLYLKQYQRVIEGRFDEQDDMFPDDDFYLEPYYSPYQDEPRKGYWNLRIGIRERVTLQLFPSDPPDQPFQAYHGTPRSMRPMGAADQAQIRVAITKIRQGIGWQIGDEPPVEDMAEGSAWALARLLGRLWRHG